MASLLGFGPCHPCSGATGEDHPLGQGPSGSLGFAWFPLFFVGLTCISECAVLYQGLSCRCLDCISQWKLRSGVFIFDGKMRYLTPHTRGPSLLRPPGRSRSRCITRIYHVHAYAYSCGHHLFLFVCLNVCSIKEGAY